MRSDDKFAGHLVSPGTYRMATDDFAVTFAVAAGKVEHIQPLMQKAGRLFVAYLVQVSDADQADALLNAESAEGMAQSAEGVKNSGDAAASFVNVETLAELLEMTERNVQLQVDNNLLVRSGPGRYDMLASYALLWKAHKELRSGQNDSFNAERTAVMRLKRLEKERLHEEAMGRLVNFEEYLKAGERKAAVIKQKLLFLEKSLPPRLAGLSANEQEPIIKDAIRKLLTEFAVAEVPRGGDHGGGQGVPAAAEPHRQPVGGRRKKARRKNKR
jgi:hypothetical protein